MKIYFDVCCLHRPFNDQTQRRIRLESEAVLLIIEEAPKKQWTFINSEALEVELEKMPDPDLFKQIVIFSKSFYSEYIHYSPEIIARGQGLLGFGLKAMDALHVACAEEGRVDILLTTDDQFLKVAKRNASELGVEVENPLSWIQKQEEQR